MKASISKLWLWTRLIAQIIPIFCSDLILKLLQAIFHIVFSRKCKDIKGETVLVTGAASSIGRQLALQLSGLGCNVICVDSDAEGNMRTAQVIVKQGYKAQAHTCDVTDNTAVEVLAKNVGYVDILINSAGVIYFDPILKTQQAMVSKVLDINVASHFVMIRNFLPQMLERNKGHIVGIASCSGLLGVSNAVLYSCSKFAVVGLMNSLYEELRHQGRHNIKTSCVCQYFLRVIEGIDNKIETRIPPLDVEDGVRQIVQGILQERSMFTVPNHMLALINIGRSVPDSTRNKLRDAVYTRIKPDAN